MEKQLLAASLRSRSSFTLIQDKASPEAKNKRDVRYSPEFRIVMDMVKTYYENDKDAASVNKELLEELIDAKVPNDKHKARFKSLVAEALSADVSLPNINALVRTAMRHEIGGKLAMKMVNREDVTEEELKAYADTLHEVEEDGDGAEGVLRADSLATALRETLSGERGLSLYPPALGEALGPRGLQDGSHVIVFGRPEISKSGFCITNTARWAMQGKKVLYFINEDPEVNIQLRILECITGLSEEDVLADIDKAMALGKKAGFDNVVIKGLTPGSAVEIDRWIEQEKPDAIVVDQLRNLWAKADSRTNQLDQVARDVRDLGKKHGVVVLSVSQAGESAEGKAILGMTDIDSSKCLAPGTMVRMFDGSTKAIEDISVGERVMGMDSTAREVLATGGGEQEMFNIQQSDGKEYTVNKDHIMVVKKTTSVPWLGHEVGAIVDMPLKDMLASPARFRHFKGISVPAEYEHKELPVDPYLLGWWLTDGSKDTPCISTCDLSAVKELTSLANIAGHNVKVREDTRHANTCYGINISGGEELFLHKLRNLGVLGNKHIPQIYLTASYEQRIRLLAGIIDGDGYLCTGGSGAQSFEIAGPDFHEDIKELCWSLGYKATSVGDGADRLYVCGDLSKIPTQLKRKQSEFVAKKDVLSAKLTVTPVGVGKYHGITVDGDERYLLANYVVVHNTGIPASADVLIGIGATQEHVATGYRVLTLCKNKVNGNHASLTVRFIPQISRYTDV